MAAATICGAAAGALAAAAYLDAKFLISNDLSSSALARDSKKAASFLAQRQQQDKLLLYYVLEEKALGSHAGNLFLIFEDRTWTYAEFFADVIHVGNWLMKELGVEKGEMVALDGGNSPEYLILWFALEAIGASPSFINCNLTAAPLIHCVTLCDARYLLADRSVQSLVEPCEPGLQEKEVKIIYYNSASIANLKDDSPIPDSRRSGFQPEDVSSLIYTSGTTGLPKACIMNRAKELNIAFLVSRYLRLGPGHRIYTCLPLYHGAAHGLCVTPSLLGGSTVILSRKFRHSTFWPEVRKHRADTIQYVGELCRYLINTPPTPNDKQHQVKRAWGNGMRPDVWGVFRERFGIETINELYAATDGLNRSFNANRGKFGQSAVGVRGLLWHWDNGAKEKRVKIDGLTGEIVRDQRGFAIESETNEPGETLIKLDPAAPDAQFAGYYKNREAGNKRYIRDVFEKNDMWFRSGDLMRQDADGCLYFVDRLGDTFRWKSENVSTKEVGDVIGDFEQIAEANVYGVLVPHADGRAGCAAIKLNEGVSVTSLDCKGLAEYALKTLPRYAVPIFLRVVGDFETTGTMKVQIGDLGAQGIDLDKIQKKDTDARMYWLPPGADAYVPFEWKEWENLKGGNVRL